jgi:hypothetical protein
MKVKPWIILLFSITFSLEVKSQNVLFINKAPIDSSKCYSITRFEDYSETFKHGEFYIDSLTFKGNCLNFYIWYRGGCGRTEVGLVWLGAIADSNPAHTSVRLMFQNNDTCKEFIERKVSFDFPYVSRIGKIYIHAGDAGQGKSVLLGKK